MSARDAVAGVLVAAAVVVGTVGEVVGPVATTRVLAAVVTALGVAAAVVGGWWLRPPVDPAPMRELAVLGMLTALTAVIAIVTGSGAALVLLLLLTVVLWVLATVRHAIVSRRR